jgi:UDP-N-acetylmuramyl pentapeptide phosphotransferase/UDP-N-acetylglucosamine-1-phosphate transferase
MQAIVAGVVAALVTWAAIAILRRSPLAARLADHPNQRSLHAVPTPRLGGLGIVLGMFPFALYYANGPIALILTCALALCLVSLADDLRFLPPALRLAAHALAAVAIWVALDVPGLPPGIAWLVGALAVLAMMWVTNLFNFMDGADGLAGGMSAIGFSAYALAAMQAGQVPLALACAALAGASLGFLAWNFPPARVFLGDAGSIPLGFLAAALGAWGAARGAWPVAFPLIVFSPFIVDATVTLMKRLIRREKVWIAHRGHSYQRLVLAGWSTRRLALASYALMGAAAASALVLARQGVMLQCGIISVWAVLYVLLVISISRKTRKTAETAQ